VVGKAVGDAKLESEGAADKIECKVQNAIGSLKDTLKGKTRPAPGANSGSQNDALHIDFSPSI
jgi:uncharacterized protein YjbJ (UPF0337 family)